MAGVRTDLIVTNCMSWHIILALLSAFVFALSIIFVKAGVRSATPTTALWLTLAVNVLLLWSWGIMRGELNPDWYSWGYFAISGMFAPLLGRLFQFQGIRHLGTNISTPITLTHPLVTVLIAVLFLEERLTITGFVGATLVIMASTLVGSEGNGGKPGQLAVLATRKRYLVLPLLASLGYGISIAFRKIGIESGADPVVAAAVTVSSAWVWLSLYLIVTGGFSQIRCARRELVYFLLSGIASGLGPVLLYAALQLADLVVVAPLASTTPLFVLFISYLFVRQDEIFTVKVIVGTIATVVGIILLTGYGLETSL